MVATSPNPINLKDRERSATERLAIDESCRGPVLYFATSAVFWLLVGSSLALLASIKLHSPYFLTGSAEFTFGRVRMAHLQAVGIGWAAMFWFPWLYTVAQMMIFWVPAKGVIQSIVNWWFGHNYLGLWLTPIGVGSAYYLIPKIIGRPVHSYYLSIIGFWSLALFYSWAGMHHLIGGPIPGWLATASTVGSVMMFIPVIAVAINHHMTMLGSFHRLKYSPALRFTVFGAITYRAATPQ